MFAHPGSAMRRCAFHQLRVVRHLIDFVSQLTATQPIAIQMTAFANARFPCGRRLRSDIFEVGAAAFGPRCARFGSGAGSQRFLGEFFNRPLACPGRGGAQS
jgi:hypothetical protein